MVLTIFPIVAAITCAVCNGSAAVLQKISADREPTADTLDAGFLWRLLQDKIYVAGLLLDVVGWMFTLFAVQYLPLFFVEAVLASSIAVTAIIERVVRHKRIGRRAYYGIAVILAGLILLALAASPDHAQAASRALRFSVGFIPLPLFIVGWFVARRKGVRPAFVLAAIGGFSYGITSVIGRIFKLSHPWWHTVYSPLFIGLGASGALGIWFFSIALQRAQATTVNAVMTASQTVFPAIIGIVFLGDKARHGLWYLVISGGILALAGVILLAYKPTKVA